MLRKLGASKQSESALPVHSGPLKVRQGSTIKSQRAYRGSRVNSVSEAQDIYQQEDSANGQEMQFAYNSHAHPAGGNGIDQHAY